eukprot:4202384-Alexandrium_andersonii.AAC.1
MPGFQSVLRPHRHIMSQTADGIWNALLPPLRLAGPAAPRVRQGVVAGARSGWGLCERADLR